MGKNNLSDKTIKRNISEDILDNINSVESVNDVPHKKIKIHKKESVEKGISRKRKSLSTYDNSDIIIESNQSLRENDNLEASRQITSKEEFSNSENSFRCDSSDIDNTFNQGTSNQNDSFTFADILSQTQQNKMRDKYIDLINEAASKEFLFELPNNIIHEDPSSFDNSKSVSKQTTLDKYFKSRKDNLETQEEKVLKSPEKSKSIDNIEKESDLSPNMDDEEKTIRTLSMKCPYSVAQIHKIAFYTSNVPSKKQRIELKDAGITYETGKFTKEEDERIRWNWKKFCDYHCLNENCYHFFLRGSVQSKNGLLSNDQMQAFAQFIAHGFEHRLMYTVYMRFKRLFSKNKLKNGRFTEEDDEIIVKYMKEKKSTQPFADIARILNRSRSPILRRYQFLKSKEKMSNKKVLWDKNLTEELIANLMKVTASSDLAQLKNRKITSKEWRKISKTMGLPEKKLHSAWMCEFHPRLFVRHYLKKIQKVKMELIEFVFQKYKDWREINWLEVAGHFDNNFTHYKLNRLLRDTVAARVPPDLRSDLHESLKYVKKHLDDCKIRSVDRFRFVKEIVKQNDLRTAQCESENKIMDDKLEMSDDEKLEESDSEFPIQEIGSDESEMENFTVPNDEE